MNAGGHHVIQKRDLIEMLARVPDWAYVAAELEIESVEVPGLPYGEERKAWDSARSKAALLHGDGIEDLKPSEVRKLCGLWQEAAASAEELRRVMQDHVETLEGVIEEITGYTGRAFFNGVIPPSGSGIHTLRFVA